MSKIGVSEARDHLSEVVDRTRYTHERIVLTKRGRDVGAIVPIEDLELLEMLEEQVDLKLARQALAESKGKRIPYEELRQKLGL